MNLSNNKSGYRSGFALYNPTGTSSTQPAEVYFSSFRNNTATNYGCLFFYSGTINLKSSNIIQNIQNTETYGTVYTEGSATLTVNECCLVGNTGGKLFYINSGSIKGSDNYVDSLMKEKQNF